MHNNCILVVRLPVIFARGFHYHRQASALIVHSGVLLRRLSDAFFSLDRGVLRVLHHTLIYDELWHGVFTGLVDAVRFLEL